MSNFQHHNRRPVIAAEGELAKDSFENHRKLGSDWRLLVGRNTSRYVNVEIAEFRVQRAKVKWPVSAMRKAD